MATVFENHGHAKQPHHAGTGHHVHHKVHLPREIAPPDRHDRLTMFTSYAINPLGVRFETQQADEQVVIFMRQHFVVNVPWILATLLLLVTPIFILPLFIQYVLVGITVPDRYVFVGTVFWYLATFGYALANFVRWYYNLYIVTTERVVDIDFVNLLYKKFSETRLTNIEDVTYTAGGIMATFFNYGNVYIQTAGETPNFEFTAIPRPATVVQAIGALLKQLKG